MYAYNYDYFSSIKLYLILHLHQPHLNATYYTRDINVYFLAFNFNKNNLPLKIDKYS